MFTRSANKRYKVISTDGVGISLRVPRHRKTDTWLGNKDMAAMLGLDPKGSEAFYRLRDGTVVIEGYLAVEAEDNTVEVKIPYGMKMTKHNWQAVKEEIEALLNFTEGDS